MSKNAINSALTTLFNHDNQPIVILSPECDVLSANVAAKKMYGPRLGERCCEAHAPDKNCFMASFSINQNMRCPVAIGRECGGSAEPIPFNGVYTDQNGQQHYEGGTITPFYTEGHEYAGVVRRVCLDNANSKDPMIDCYNHKTGMFLLKKALHSQREADFPLLIGFYDADALKFVNDIYDHAKGNAYLKAIAGVIKECLRQDDVLLRYAGDEFISLSPGFDDETSLTARLREGFISSSFSGRLPHVSASFGYKLITKEMVDVDPDAVIAELSKKMEDQKRSKGPAHYLKIHNYLLKGCEISPERHAYFDMLEKLVKNINVLTDEPKEVLLKTLEFHKAGVNVSENDPLPMAKILACQLANYLSTFDPAYAEVYTILNRVNSMSQPNSEMYYMSCGDLCSKLSCYYHVAVEFAEAHLRSGCAEGAVNYLNDKVADGTCIAGFVNIIVQSAKRSGFFR